MGTPDHPPVDVRAVLDNIVSDAGQAAEAEPGNPHLHAKWQDAEQLRYAVNGLLNAAASGNCLVVGLAQGNKPAGHSSNTAYLDLSS